jgi:GntR family transcriptional regulator
MLYQLNTSDDRPIYSQIADQVKFAVAAGLLRPGQLVPSVRELARQLVVNPNTVARAYRDLQGEGVLDPVRGTGLQVAQGAPEACRDGRREFVRRRLRDALDEARRSNLALDEIEAILLDEWSRGNGTPTNRASTGGSEAKEGGGR